MNRRNFIKLLAATSATILAPAKLAYAEGLTQTGSNQVPAPRINLRGNRYMLSASLLSTKRGTFVIEGGDGKPILVIQGLGYTAANHNDLLLSSLGLPRVPEGDLRLIRIDGAGDALCRVRVIRDTGEAVLKLQDLLYHEIESINLWT